MSRYYLEIKKETEETVFVGWDNPLQTFFVQVFMGYDTAEEELVLEMGSRFKQIPTFAHFTELLNLMGYNLEAWLTEYLESDFLHKTEPTPLQKKVNSMFEEVSKKLFE